jgi:hypothetical protein
VVPRGAAGGDDALREQLSALRGLLVLSMLLTRQDDEAGILHLVASAVESLGHCRTERILYRSKTRRALRDQRVRGVAQAAL